MTGNQKTAKADRYSRPSQTPRLNAQLADIHGMKTGSVVVDIDSLTTLSHRCTGCPKTERCCCARYDICISTQEMERIVGHLPPSAVFCPHLKTKDGYDNVFEQVENDLFLIDTTDADLCVFAYHRHQETRCALHSVALSLGLPINMVKPEACLLWPLALSATAPYTLSIHVDAFQFKCNVARPRQKSLHTSTHDIITTVFGPRFARDVTHAVLRGLSSIELDLELATPT